MLKTHQSKTSAVALKANALAHQVQDGREYAVVQTVVIVEGVLNGALVTAAEIVACAELWNGQVIPLRHPQDAQGNYISAQDPTVPDADLVGFFRNARVDDNRLVGEMWLDVAKIQQVGGDALITLNRLEAGEIVEVSSAYFCQAAEETGEYKGKRYHEVHRALEPDHIALLPDEVGACSVQDGCGAGRVNAGLDDSTELAEVKLDHRTVSLPNCGCKTMRANAAHDGVMVAFYLREADAQAMALQAAPDGVEVMPVGEMHVTLAYLGKADEVEIDQALLLDYVASFAQYHVMVLATVNGQGRFLNAARRELADTAENDGMEPIFAMVESERLHQIRCELVEQIGYMVDVSRAYGFIPHVTLAYAPAGVELPLMVERRELVFDRLAVSWAGTTITFPLQGELRQEEMAVNELEQAKVVKANEGDGGSEATTTVVEEVAAVAPAALPENLVKLGQAVDAIGGVDALMGMLAGLQTNAAQLKAQLIGQIKTNRSNAFSDAQLQAMSTEMLATLARTLTPASYAGQGGAVFNSAVDEEWQAYQAPQ